ncbi:four helix bundle protein [Brevundimonas sp. Root1279]|uniref:four helix bundle protein n=1 Tax=Brevundimonas sp. Root1279 TaxID=1736443 RepID=UPI0006FAF70D|nr:four helix bundle protein [Brevundimonas sp. Root1279]KQW83909.1 four helix bundle protein [Brevundimonas sp. Root1279]
MTDGVTNYRDLQVWRKSLDWAEGIYEASAHWPRDERFGLIGQIRRAAVSVASNIAEGAARRSTGEFIQFVGMARGSLAEAETQLILAERLGYLPNVDARALLLASEDISRMLVALSSALSRRKDGGAGNH